jgi:type I restriction enzyme M protein
MNERKTEDLVDNRLHSKGYYRAASGVTVEKQQSELPRIQKLLEHASKRGLGAGKPEFIIRSPHHPDLLIIIECKASPQRHVSPSLDRYADFAVDGVLLYASYLAKGFDVIAIAATGQDEANLRISHYFHLHGEPRPIEFPTAREIVSFEEYYHAFIHSDAKFRQDYSALLDYSRALNNVLQAKKITEAERGFLISGILIALQNVAFMQSYRSHHTAKQLAANLLETIRHEFENAKLPQVRRDGLAQAFAFIAQSPALVQDKEFFVSLIQDIDKNINAFMRTHEYYDTIGQFYVEFLRYANNDKGLGIVLTPRHVAELFADLAEVNRDSIVFDNCCGTAGLLIAAMKAMIHDAGPDERVKRRIRNRQLFGIEYQPNVYALAVSNMVLHGDGKTNIFRGDCFADANRLLAGRRPTVGLLNPPYKNKRMKDDKEELEFVLNNLDCLEQGGKCVAIVPITCATAPSGVIADLKRAILERHTLEAVVSMPVELFHNSKTTVVTCILVFTAHRPHPGGKKTWFGYWRDDGFVKTKHRGRIDANNMWSGIKAKLLGAFRSREIVNGLSVMAEVTAQDEWCAEAYMQTDYGVVTPAAPGLSSLHCMCSR